MPLCPRCNEEKPIDAFNKRSGRAHSTYCRECNRDYLRTHYAANPNYYLAKNQRQKRSNRDRMVEYLADKKCIDCGESDPVVLQFDHRDGVTKIRNVSHMIPHYSWAAIMAEIAKCDIRCANCHARRTARSVGWYSLRTGVTGNTADFESADSRFEP